MRYRISLGIHIICHAKNLRKHRITDKVPYEVLFGQFNRVPLLQLPFEPKLLRALKTETDLERLLKANDPWTDAIKPSTESLVDLTIDQNKAEDEDEKSVAEELNSSPESHSNNDSTSNQLLGTSIDGTTSPESHGNNDSTSNQLLGTFIDIASSKGVAEELTSLPESHDNNDSTSNQLLGETGNLLGDINDAHIVSGHDKVITERFQKRVEKAFNGYSLGT